MWIDARAVVEFDAAGRIAAVRQVWRFDDMFGAYATQGLSRKPGGGLPPDVLRTMAEDWMKALGEPVSHYFTRVTQGARTLPFGPPRDAAVSFEDGRLTLAFTLPLAEPAPAGGATAVDIYDPTYFVAYAFDEAGATALRGAPAGCSQAYRPPRPLDWATMQQLAAIPADPEALPEELFAITKGLTHRIEVTCP
ncbi:DUF1007 family protein [Bordetella bronchiseptica]|uniref:DUF1007 family protein n=1 Tax=Bordetella bronchiseptica TaxID=518 RepID=UPI00028BB286|nr:DUF1007 family protein [Bordetella bronchiseptica]CCJ56932.1 conserved hypothetical protein [Bordetella bronchiseptica MO149]